MTSSRHSLLLALALTACNYADPNGEVLERERPSSGEEMGTLPSDQGMMLEVDLDEAEMGPNQGPTSPADMPPDIAPDMADCVPMAPTPESACSAQGAGCGEILVPDGCGAQRPTECGVCPGLELCVANACEIGRLPRPAALDASVTFGHVIAARDGRVAVGTPGAGAEREDGLRVGAAFVFTQRPDGTWALEQALAPMETPTLVPMRTGSALAFDDAGGLWVGAERTRDGNQPGSDHRSGYVFGFSAVGATWTQGAQLEREGLKAGAMLGASLLISGDTIFMGAPGARGGLDGTTPRVGEVQVARRDASRAWETVEVLEGQRRQARQSFGTAMTRLGDRLIVSEPGDYGETRNDVTSRVVVFELDGSGRWDRLNGLELEGDDIEAGSEIERDSKFGYALATSGADVIAGAPQVVPPNFNTMIGVVTVLDLTGEKRDDWSVKQTLLFDSNPINSLEDDFGTALAATDTLFAAGAPGVDDDAGAVVLYTRTPNDTWAELARLSSPMPGARFGASLAIDGGLLYVGAPGSGEPGSPLGEVYVYALPTSAP